jgi:hypothetical protein
MHSADQIFTDTVVRELRGACGKILAPRFSR